MCLSSSHFSNTLKGRWTSPKGWGCIWGAERLFKLSYDVKLPFDLLRAHRNGRDRSALSPNPQKDTRMAYVVESSVNLG
jgi:hypothetical protein